MLSDLGQPKPYVLFNSESRTELSHACENLSAFQPFIFTAKEQEKISAAESCSSPRLLLSLVLQNYSYATHLGCDVVITPVRLSQLQVIIANYILPASRAVLII